MHLYLQISTCNLNLKLIHDRWLDLFKTLIWIMLKLKSIVSIERDFK